MSGQSLSLGLNIDMSRLTAKDMDERAEKIAAYAADYPRRSQALLRAVIHEALFYDASFKNNRQGAEWMLTSFEDIEDQRFVYVSGIGRNAIGLVVGQYG